MISATETSWKITSQLMLPKASNIFPPNCIQKPNNAAAKPAMLSYLAISRKI